MRPMRVMTIMVPLLAVLLSAQSAAAQNASVLNPSGLPLPRFASLKSDEINMRVGPGERYPITSVYTRKQLPVEIIEEFAHWRRIRDPQGATGWVHKNLLSGIRSGIIVKDMADIRSKPQDAARVNVRAGKGRIGNLHSCAPDWCEIALDGYEGWINKADIWGANREEVFDAD